MVCSNHNEASEEEHGIWKKVKETFAIVALVNFLSLKKGTYLVTYKRWSRNLQQEKLGIHLVLKTTKFQNHPGSGCCVLGVELGGHFHFQKFCCCCTAKTPVPSCSSGTDRNFSIPLQGTQVHLVFALQPKFQRISTSSCSHTTAQLQLQQQALQGNYL